MQKHKRILICPLDWGLGHATRCIPIIRLLLQKNAEVIIAADGRPLTLLQQEFPQLQFVIFRGYSISYPDSGAMVFKMLLSTPKILKGIKEEHLELQKIVEEQKIDIVISDNRYGCWSKKAKSIFITHQLMIKSPFAESFLHKKVLRYLANYDECWIPDLKGENNLSGDLAHKHPLPSTAFFIGALSRFTFSNPSNSEYDVMAVISGPEPQRTIFEQLLHKQIQESNLKSLLVLGTPEAENRIREDKNVTIVSHLKASDMQQCILKSRIIVARSGYSTIMDLAVLGKKAVFVPTPGQTEQEYLAESLSNRGIAYSQNQSDFDLQKALNASEQFTGFERMNPGAELEKRIDLLKI